VILHSLSQKLVAIGVALAGDQILFDKGSIYQSNLLYGAAVE
jgi:hypothetical protein